LRGKYFPIGKRKLKGLKDTGGGKSAASGGGALRGSSLLQRGMEGSGKGTTKWGEG